MSTLSDEDAAKQRRMRKGTHSCRECRERKVRCIFKSGLEICDNCLRRGRSCVDQGNGKSQTSETSQKKSVSERLGEIEGVVREILHKIDSHGGSSVAADSPTTPRDNLERLRLELLRSSKTAADIFADVQDEFPVSPRCQREEAATPLTEYESAPLLSLVDNAVIKGVRVTRPNEEFVNGEDPRNPTSTRSNDAVLALLRSMMPKINDVRLIVRSTRNPLDMWREIFPDTLLGEFVRDKHYEDLWSQISQALTSNDVPVKVKILLCLTICLQQLPTSFDMSETSLPFSVEALQSQYLATAESVLAVDATLTTTVDGLECMLMQSRFYVNMGRPRMAWLAGQRALSIFQVLGKHRQMRDTSNASAKRWEALRMEFWQRDRWISLLLGLPHASSHIKSDIIPFPSPADEMQLTQIFWTNLGIIAGHVIERNQNPSKMTFSATLEIDQEIDQLRRSMPPSWWDLVPDPRTPRKVLESVFVAHFIFHNLRKLLHLPFMLKAITDSRYQFSREMALEASREMIRIYKILRDPICTLLLVCNIEDFQVFTAVMVLVVDLLGNSQSLGTQRSEHDWDIVQTATGMFKLVSEERGCTVAAQSARVLEDLTQARYDFPQTGEDIYDVVIPYFGRVTITRQAPTTLDHGARIAVDQENQPLQPSMDELGNNFDFHVDSFFLDNSQIQPLPGEGQGGRESEMGWPDMRYDIYDDWALFQERFQ